MTTIYVGAQLKFSLILRNFLIPRILKKRFDLVHIDGDHSFEACLFDLSLYYPMAKKFVLVHDYYSKANPEVKPAIAEFEKRIGGFKKIQIFNSTQGLFLIEK